jgi:hypothetical protein
MRDCQPHTITCWLFSPGDDRNAPTGLPYMIAMVVQKAASTSETPKPTQNPIGAAESQQKGLLKAIRTQSRSRTEAGQFLIVFFRT